MGGPLGCSGCPDQWGTSIACPDSPCPEHCPILELGTRESGPGLSQGLVVLTSH